MSRWSFAPGPHAGKGLLIATAAFCAPAARPAHAQQQRAASGRFHAIWVDPRRPTAPADPVYMLVDDTGRWTRLGLSAATLRAAGGVRALDRARVTVTGSDVAPAPTRAPSGAMTPSLEVRSFGGTSSSIEPSVSSRPEEGAKPYVTILCRYSDSTATPYAKSVYEAWMGSAYPGLDDYWRQLSNGAMNIQGSVVVGWYTLPHPYSYYFSNGSQSDPNFDALLTDCADAADADVDFPRFAGILLQFNGNAGAAYGGSSTITRDGETKSYGVTWMPNWSTPATYAHEMGHTLGWPHSHGPYGQTYDSRWDVMSYPYGWYENSLAPSTWIGEETIAYDKDFAGWMPASRKLVPAMPSKQSIVLERSAQPASSTGYWMVQIPIGGDAGPWYTAEARRFVSYDAHLPGEAVVLHTVDTSRPEWAWVVDVDGNGDPNDAGAMWTPGETFSDSVNGVTITVDSATASGFGVTVVRGWRLELQVTGPGTIVSSSSGSCASNCTTVLGTRGQSVTLTATPGGDGAFTGWDGACSGLGPCTITMLGDRSVTAHFGQRSVVASDSARANAVMGAPYTDTLIAAGVGGPAQWTLTSGALPAGLVLDSATGVLHGIPAQAGVFHATATARRDTVTGTAQLQLTVVEPVLPVASVMDQLLGAGTPLNADAVRFLDLLGNKNGHLDVGDVRAWLIETRAIPSAEKSP